MIKKHETPIYNKKKKDGPHPAQDPSPKDMYKNHVLTPRRHRRHDDTEEDYEKTKEAKKKTVLYKRTNRLNVTSIGEEQPHKLHVLERSLPQGYNTSSRHHGQLREALAQLRYLAHHREPYAQPRRAQDTNNKVSPQESHARSSSLPQQA